MSIDRNYRDLGSELSEAWIEAKSDELLTDAEIINMFLRILQSRGYEV